MTEKTEVINTRFSGKEKQIVEQYAIACGLTRSEYLRKRALGYAPRPALNDDFYQFYSKLCDLCNQSMTVETEKALLELITDIRRELMLLRRQSKKDGGSVATTGFWPIKGRLKDAIDYAQNPDKTTDRKFLDEDLYSALCYASNDSKTDKKMYVSAINCPKQLAYETMMDTKRRYGKLGGNVAYGEVTPQEAHTIGMETAGWMWGDDYEIVVTTHLNTENIHNHIVVNSVSFRTGRKFENHISDHYRLHEISDAVCQEHGKSVLKNTIFYGGEKGAYWVHKDGGMTHRDILRRDIDEVLSKVSIYRHFFEYLENLGYEVRGDVDSPNLSVIAEGWQRPVRLKSLGAKYTPDAIKERLLRNLDDRNLYWIAIPEKRRAPESEKPVLKLQAKAVTQKMEPLRKQQRIAKRIAERSAPKVENLLAMERQQETEVTRGRMKGARHDERNNLFTVYIVVFASVALFSSKIRGTAIVFEQITAFGTQGISAACRSAC